MKILDRYAIPRELRSADLERAIAYFKSVGLPKREVQCDCPIFVFSAGWRSGSTLVQRLICSDKKVLIWGEPYGDRIPIPRMAAMMDGFHDRDPHLKYSVDMLSGNLAETWIANTNPGIGPLSEAQLLFFETLFALPGRERGFNRWGAKFVRLTGAHALYLQWLYPKAKFIFLTRHPMHSYRSYFKNQWYSVRPGHKMDHIVKFFCHWRFLTESFLQYTEDLDSMIIRYEDLVDPQKDTITRLEAFLGYTLDRKVLERKIGGKPRREKGRLNRFNLSICHLLTAREARRMGYGVDIKTGQTVVRSF